LFEFSTISSNGRDYRFHPTFCGIRLLLKDADNFGEMLFRFKAKNLKLCSGFKPIAHKVVSFPQKCVKGCPMVTTANLYKLVHDGLTI